MLFDLKPSHYVHLNVPGDGLAVIDALDIEVVLLLVEENPLGSVEVVVLPTGDVSWGVTVVIPVKIGRICKYRYC